MRLDRTGVESALEALAQQWEILASPNATLKLVICGGAALQALGLVEARTTRDVDVLAIAETGDTASALLLSAEPLPPDLQQAAARVARDFGLPAGWLNAGPTGLLTEGLPEGFAERLEARAFGTSGRLGILFASRVDQICLKTYAAINGGGARHLTDLRALKPSTDEMIFAARWAVTQDAADFFPDLVRDFLRKTGFAEVADAL